MTQTINLRQARKARNRARKKAEADANAAKHGRSKAARALDDARDDKARRHLDHHRRADAPE